MEGDLYGRFMAAADEAGNKNIFLIEDRGMTYAEAAGSVADLAIYLRNMGFERGDNVGMAVPNGPEFVLTLLAGAALGLTWVPLNTSLPDEELLFMLRMAECRGLAGVPATMERVRHLGRLLGEKFRTVSVEDERYGAGGGVLEKRPHVDSEDIAVIFFTSGTTGRPKGAMLSHGAVIADAESCMAAFELTAGISYYSLIPMFHAFASTVCVVIPLISGGTMVFGDPARVNPGIVVGVPAALSRLIKIAEEKGRETLFGPDLEYFVSGGSSLPGAVRRRIEEIFDRRVYEGYGTTECSPVVSAQTPKERGPDGFVGRPLPGVDVRIMDESGAEKKAGEAGEITVGGRIVMSGYYDLDEPTDAALKGGRFHTGDIGYLDEAGFLRIIDRKSDVIRRKGIRIHPKEVEDVLLSHPEVAEAAVVGVPEDGGGEVPVAFIVLRDGSGGDPAADLKDYCAGRMAFLKIPVSVVVMEDLPKTSTGKVLKRTLRQKWF